MTRRLVVLVALGACGPSEGKQGECKDSLVVGDLVITEVFADFKAQVGGSGADEGKEWFEIYNATDRPIELEGMRVDHSRPDGSKLKSHVMAAVTIAPGQYFTLGNATPDLVPAYIDYGYSADLGDMFNSDGGRLALSCGDTEIDASDYDSVKEGRSRQLTASTFPDYTLNDDLANWCEGVDTEFEAGNFGTPGSDNDCTPVIAGACTEGGVSRPATPPMPGQLVITEMMPNPDGTSDTTAEWFEVKALADIDLNGIGLDRIDDTAAPKVIESAECLHLNAGESGLFVKSTDAGMNGSLPPAAIKGVFTFSLVDGSVAEPTGISVLFGTTVIDTVTWTDATAGKSISLDPSSEDPIANDSESAFCPGTTVYFTNTTTNKTDSGTPGADNTTCPVVVQPGQCDDGVTIRAIVPPTAGNLVITELMPKPLVGNSGGAEWFEVTNTGGAPFDLIGLGLDRAADTRKPDVIGGSECRSLAPGAFAVFARSAVPASNGGIENVTATFGFSMVDSNGNAQIVDPATCDVVAPFTCTTVFDRVDWASTSGTTQIPRAGISAQLRSDQFTATANDATPTNYCAGSAPYGTDGNLGTPGTADAACPP